MGKKTGWDSEQLRLPCVATGEPNADWHHVKTRGSGGTEDEWNKMPLSRLKHSEVHHIGLTRFADKYPRVKEWLVTHGWSVDPVLLRWTHVKKPRGFREEKNDEI